MNLIEVKKNLFSLLTIEGKRKCYLVILLLIIVSIIDAIGIASIMPFIAILSDEGTIKNSKYVILINEKINIKEKSKLAIYFGIVTLVLLISSIILKMIGTKYQWNFILKQEYYIAKKIFELSLSCNYLWYLKENRNKLTNTILTEISGVVQGGLLPLMQLIANMSVIITIMIVITYIDYELALISTGVFGAFYVTAYILIKKYLQKIGELKVEANEERFKVIDEAYGAIREIKSMNLERYYQRNFDKPAYDYAHYQAQSSTIIQMPRFVIEGIAFGGMLIFIIIYMSNHNNISSITSIIVLYAYAGYRIMPAIQNIFSNVSMIKYSQNSIEKLSNYKKDLEINKVLEIEKKEDEYKIEKIELKSISFKYPSSKELALNKINLTIIKGESIGIIGLTGSGKTTLTDIIQGLIMPCEGEITINNNIEINEENIKVWKNNIAYVPQNIYISNNSVEANIAFGLDKNKINRKKLIEAAKEANIHEFIINELNNGYECMLGERGIRLSGGQKQRIAIARALYRNASILIMDEATSSLDNITEKIIIETIRKLKNKKTIITVAHRISTIIDCDKIIQLENGRIIAEGKYQDLINKSNKFTELVNIQNDKKNH